jgi:hypothetical protein
VRVGQGVALAFFWAIPTDRPFEDVNVLPISGATCASSGKQRQR